MMRHDRVLCILNRKRRAVRLAKTLAEEKVDGLLHLSTNMCPAHRAAVLAVVNRRLSNGLPVRLVATQCVEAGVDLDFPVVYRALGPPEAIAHGVGAGDQGVARRVRARIETSRSRGMPLDLQIARGGAARDGALARRCKHPPYALARRGRRRGWPKQP